MSSNETCLFNSKIKCGINKNKYSRKELKRICYLCNDNPQDWYEKNIEEPIRELVKLLRNNGINTICSCGHEMYCECETYGNFYDEAKGVYDLLVKNGYKHFRIEEVRGIDETGRNYACLTVWIPKLDGKLSEIVFNNWKGNIK